MSAGRLDTLELGAWLRLNAATGVGPKSARQLLAVFGSPQAIFSVSRADLKQVVSANQADALQTVSAAQGDALDKTLQWLDTPLTAERRGDDGHDSFRAVLCVGDALYPRALLRIEDPPLLLYVHAKAGFWHEGSLFLDEQPGAVAIVGSRNATTQGLINAKSFSKELCTAGWAIVSGLATGIDAAAHEGAIDAARAGTIAVIGTGIDRIYPQSNASLARQIVQHGAIVSEFPIGTPVLASNFPRRNRIIAGLSRGTLVVEAAIKSGSLITARLAAEQGKEVFAIPGSIHSVQAKGCHALIKQGAQLVESAQDVLNTTGFGERHFAINVIATNSIKSLANPENASDNVAPHPLLTLIGHDPLTLDELANRSGESAQYLQAQLLELELAGKIERLPGNTYQQIGAA